MKQRNTNTLNFKWKTRLLLLPFTCLIFKANSQAADLGSLIKDINENLLSDPNPSLNLNTPITTIEPVASYPPIHHHEDNGTHHSSDSDSQVKTVILEESERQPSIIPSMLNGDQVMGLPKGGGNEEVETEPSVNMLPVNLHLETEEEREMFNQAYNDAIVSQSEATSQKVSFEEVESPLNDFDDGDLGENEANEEYLASHQRFYENEPDTGIHGVKLANGHLHVQDKVYPFFDPSKPHDESDHPNRYTATGYVITGTLYFAFLLSGIFICYLIYQFFFCLFGKKEYSQFENDRGDSVTSTSSYFGKQKQEEFRQNELKGELDPAIFYKNQLNGTENSTDKRDGKRLKLDFDSVDKESDRREQEVQKQLKNLDFSVDYESNSKEMNNGNDVRRQSFPSKENSQYAI